MPTSLKKLFAQSGSPKNDGLTQAQREALVDLLHYCMYADNLVALKEDQFINSVASTLSWDANISFETYEGMSIGNARRAKEQGAYREEFMKSVSSRLGATEVRQLAFDLVKQLFSTLTPNLQNGNRSNFLSLRARSGFDAFLIYRLHGTNQDKVERDDLRVVGIVTTTIHCGSFQPSYDGCYDGMT